MNKDYTKTATWKAWRKSLLVSFEPNDSVTKPLLGLLLIAKSLTELEKFSVSPILPPTCRLSVELRKALKSVWQVMRDNKEEWVIFAASLEGLGLGIGLTRFYWNRLCQGRPLVKYTQPERPEGFALPLCGPDEICSFARISKLGEGEYLARIQLKDDIPDFLYKVKVMCYYPGHGEMLVTLEFDKRMFTESNAVAFQKMMPPYAVVVDIPSGRSDVDPNSPTICYRFSVTAGELPQYAEFGEFRYLHPHSQYSGWYEYIRPWEGFLKFISAKLAELGVPFAKSLSEC